MPDTVSTLLKLGLGTLVLTRERAKKLIDELAKQGEVSKADAQKLIRDLVKKGEHSEKVMRREIHAVIEKIVKKLDVPSRKEIDGLKAEIAALKKARKRRPQKK